MKIGEHGHGPRARKRRPSPSQPSLSRREEEIRRDPAALFRTLPGVELSADEIEAMRERVGGVLRARGVAGEDPREDPPEDRGADRSVAGTGSSSGPRSKSSGRRPGRTALGVAATAAAVLLALGIGLADSAMDDDSATAVSATGAAVPGELALDPEEQARLEASLAARPLVEGVGLATDGQQVQMQFALAEIDLAFVSDASLEL